MVNYYIVKICVDCWLVRNEVFEEASIGKTIAISLLNVIHKLVLTVFS